MQSLLFSRFLLVLALMAIMATGTAGAQAPQPAGATDLSSGCVAGGPYDPACDVDHDGDVDVADLQRVASHWSQSGTFASDAWLLTGNSGTTPAANFLGTTDNQPLELRVKNSRALRLEPVTGNLSGYSVTTANLIGGHSSNRVAAGVLGGTIGGGGAVYISTTLTLTLSQVISGSFGTIGGGANNIVSSTLGTIAGGTANRAGDTASVGGGLNNIASGQNAVIAGGHDSRATAAESTVGGGGVNYATGPRATIGGGYGNVAGDTATVGGGASNTASQLDGTIGGGEANMVLSTYGTIGGGRFNFISDTVGTIGGGTQNYVKGAYGTIGGGHFNVITDTISTIAGGFQNAIYGSYGTIGGGYINVISKTYGTIAGGFVNVVSATLGTVGGGSVNRAGDTATVAGGYANIASGADSTISGGHDNRATASESTVGGGGVNYATGPIATIGGGYNNTAGNTATVAGGRDNIASGQYATIPGGASNVVLGKYSLAAGRGAQANQDGTFVWADCTSCAGAVTNFTSTGSNQFLVRAAGGVGIGTNAPENQFHVVASTNDTATPGHHVAQIENSSTGNSADVLALKIGQTGNAVGSNNYITFFNGNDNSLGAIEGNGSGSVVLAGAGSDYAEWLPRLDPAEALAPGDIVGVFGGHITRVTRGAAHLMIVSDGPIVAGNDPGEAQRGGYATVAFVGQVQARVWGPVHAGDLIVPSGLADGTGLAVSSTSITTEQLGQITGQAWEDSATPGLKTVRVVVGLFYQGAVLPRLVAANQAQAAQIAALQEQNAQLAARLSKLEQAAASKSADAHQ